MPSVDWNDETLERLQALWAAGHSTQRIADLMNISKNAVVGKAHRINLPSRASPIKRGVLDVYLDDPAFVAAFSADWRSDAQRVAVAEKHGIGVERAYMLARRLGLPLAERHKVPVVTLAPLKSVGVVARAEPVSVPLRAVSKRKTEGCQFPIGDPKAAGFRFCEAPQAEGPSVYCPTHHAACWHKVLDRRVA